MGGTSDQFSGGPVQAGAAEPQIPGGFGGGQFGQLGQIPNVSGAAPQGMGAWSGQKGMGPQSGGNIPGTNIPNEPMQKPNGQLTPANPSGNTDGGGLSQPNSGPQTGPFIPATGPLTPVNQGGGGQQGPGGSLIGGGIGTPYWEQQYQQNPGNVQNYYSPPAANQLGQFYPGQQIFPGVQGPMGGGGGTPPPQGKGQGTQSVSPVGGRFSGTPLGNPAGPNGLINT